MTITRRSINKGVAGLLATPLLGASAASVHAQAPAVNAQAAPPHDPAASHDMSAMPAHWMGKEQIAFLIYPEFTALDMVGPHYMMTSLMGATVHIVAKTRDPVKSDTGLVVVPSATFEECPKDLDIICIPGGTLGTLAAMQDDATIAFLRDRARVRSMSRRFVPARSCSARPACWKAMKPHRIGRWRICCRSLAQGCAMHGL